jgi:hypothetical protein
VHEVVCAYIGVFLESERWWCQNSSAYVVTAIMLLRQEYNSACETRAEGYHAKWRGRGTTWHVRPVLEVITQNDGDYVDVILLYCCMTDSVSLVSKRQSDQILMQSEYKQLRWQTWWSWLLSSSTYRCSPIAQERGGGLLRKRQRCEVDHAPTPHTYVTCASSESTPATFPWRAA